MTDLRGVDLARTSFDFDLTFAALLMHPDGHVYHRYGSRDERSASRWLGETSWRRVLEGTLEEHELYRLEPSPPIAEPALFLERVPAFRKRDKGACIHCHSVFPALYEEALAANRWSPEQLWVYPPPARLGMDLDAEEQALVLSVQPGSPAEVAGLAVGDRLLAVGEQRLLSVSDLSHRLHTWPATGGVFELVTSRDGERVTRPLELGPDWKRGTPLEFSWRPFKWGLSPAPGFGGVALRPEELRAANRPEGSFAFRVDYLVTWGENRRFGEHARRIGLREGDLFVGVAGEPEFASVDHFHAWWRLTRSEGEKVTVLVSRERKALGLEFTVLR